MSKLRCSHTISQERKDQHPPRFIDDNKSRTLEEVLDMDLVMSKMPHDVNTISPTPLDPYSLSVNGIRYEAFAREYMLGQLYRSTENLGSSNQMQIKQAEAEIIYQHRHRMAKNTEAMDRWKDKAATIGDGSLLSHEEAEGIMQVRAGVASITAMTELLARNPTMGGIEIAKATRPFCRVAHTLAQSALTAAFQKPHAKIEFILDKSAKPYRFSIDEHNKALITKTRMGITALSDVDMELIARDSSILYNREYTEQIPEAVSGNMNGIPIDSIPLDTTVYLRVAE